MMTAAYKPLGIILGILAGILGRKLFEFAWTKISDEEPPEPTTQDVPWTRLLATAAVQGVIFRITRVVVDRYGAIGWAQLTGEWPGERRPEPD
jgi:Protein of unknown function (DUF4235)